MGWLTSAQAAAMSEEDRLDYLTKTVLGEAVGEGLTGMLVVAQVIANRSSDARWPSDPVAAAGQPYQFSTNNPGFGGNQGMVAQYGRNSKEYQTARAAVQAAIINKTAPDVTGNAKYYHTVSMGWPSAWPSSIKKNGFVDIGNHRVYPDRPIAPGEIPANLRLATEFGVASLLDVRQQGLKPIRPAKLSTTLTLQREINRVAQQQATAPSIRRNARLAAAGMSMMDPLAGTGRPANTNPVINRPIPAMKQSLQRELRATGLPGVEPRPSSFAGQERGAPKLAPTKPAAVVTAPWGVRQEVAAQVAAAAANNGRGQIVMTGNPNIAGSVVDWLYPKIAEGDGEANQVGKGPRSKGAPGQSIIERNKPAVGQSIIERNPPAKKAPPQSQIERSPSEKPLVVVAPGGKVSVIPQSQIERSAPTLITETMRRANKANDPALAVTLANQIATNKAKQTADDLRTIREANQNAAPAKPPAKPAVTPATQQTAANMQTLRNANQNAKPAVPGPNAPPKIQERLPVTPPIPAAQPKPAVKLPPIAPPRSDPIGTMPDFKQLAMVPANPLVPMPAVRPAIRPVTPNSPTPASVEDRVTARNKANNVISIRKDAPIPASVEDRVTARNTGKDAPVPANPALRPVIGQKPATKPVQTVRVTTTAPVPASVEDRVTARNTAPTIVAPGGTSKSGSGGVSKGGVNPVTKKSPGTSSSPSSSSSGSGGTKAPTFVSASTGKTLSPVTVSSYNPDTNSFEKRTVFR